MPELSGLGKTESLEKWTGLGALWGGLRPSGAGEDVSS